MIEMRTGVHSDEISALVVISAIARNDEQLEPDISNVLLPFQ